MEIRAILQLRNNKMIEARKRLGLSQIEVSEAVGISVYWIQMFERFRYTNYNEDNVGILAAFLELDIEDIFPKEMAGNKIQADFVQISEVPTSALLEASQRYTQRYILPNPADKAEVDDLIEHIKTNLGTLTFRQEEIIKLRYGLNDKEKAYSAEEVARIFKVTSSSVRMIETVALRKLRDRFQG